MIVLEKKNRILRGVPSLSCFVAVELICITIMSTTLILLATLKKCNHSIYVAKPNKIQSASCELIKGKIDFKRVRFPLFFNYYCT